MESQLAYISGLHIVREQMGRTQMDVANLRQQLHQLMPELDMQAPRDDMYPYMEDVLALLARFQLQQTDRQCLPAKMK